MDYGMNREEALTLLKENVQNENLIKHCLATEAVMKALAESLGEDKEKWGLTGLLHDLDVELVQGDSARHCEHSRRAVPVAIPHRRHCGGNSSDCSHRVYL